MEKHDGFRTAAIHTGHLGPQDLEEIVAEANKRWQGVWVQRKKIERDYPIEVSVVIPNFHQREVLKRCLRALRAQTFDRFEVILVDNGSRDDSVSAARDIVPDIQVIEISQPLGFSKAVNLGIKRAQGRYVAVLNNDTEPEPEWLGALVAVLEERDEVGVVASLVLRSDDPQIVDSFGDGLSMACFPFQNENGTMVDAGLCEPREVFGAPATAAVYRKQLLDDVGGFDEDFETYLEDLDLSLRAQLRGWRCLAIPQARVMHQGQVTSGGVNNAKVVRLLARNWIQLIVKSVPRRVLMGNALSILGTGVRQGLYHSFRSRHPLAYGRGLLEGLFRVPALLRKRKTVLGWRQVDDDRILSLLELGSRQLQETRRRRAGVSG